MTCVTKQFLQECASQDFCSSVKSYPTENKMDNAPGYVPELASSLTATWPSIRVKFLSPNTTSFIQQVTANFKRLYTKKFPQMP
jgi:hypothetical protein